MSVKLVTAPTENPVSLAELKSQINWFGFGRDTYLSTLITAATNTIEALQGRALVTQTWDLFLDCFPNVIHVPKPPLASVSSITHVATDGTSTITDTSVYTVDADHLPGRIYEAYNQNWPDTREVRKAVTVRFVAGYGAASDVPQETKQAILLLAAHLWQQRAPVAMGTIVAEIPWTIEQLAALHTFRADTHI